MLKSNCRLESELDAVRRAALADKVVMREYIETLREQAAELPVLREAEHQLIVQVEDLIASMQTESAQIVRLIDTVQSSRFWKVKRLLSRVRAQVLRR